MELSGILFMTALAADATPTRSLPADYGRFCWNIRHGAASWSDSVFRLHGHQPGQVTASTALAFRHEHPEDLYGYVDALHAGMVLDRLIVHEHRLVGANGRVRPVVTIARPVREGDGRVQQLRGLLLAAFPLPPATAGTSGVTVALVPVLMHAFGVGEPAAQVLLAARRPLTAWRSLEQRAFARRYPVGGPGDDLRRTLEDSMFPLDHLTADPVDLAA